LQNVPVGWRQLMGSMRLDEPRRQPEGVAVTAAAQVSAA
jgi:hypothetical protein